MGIEVDASRGFRGIGADIIDMNIENEPGIAEAFEPVNVVLVVGDGGTFADNKFPINGRLDNAAPLPNLWVKTCYFRGSSPLPASVAPARFAGCHATC